MQLYKNAFEYITFLLKRQINNKKNMSNVSTYNTAIGNCGAHSTRLICLFCTHLTKKDQHVIYISRNYKLHPVYVSRIRR